MTDFTRWMRWIRIQRIRTEHRLAIQYNDKPVISVQYRQRLFEATKIQPKNI
jgi:hypothetical protein